MLIPLSIVVAACFLGAFVWAVRSGQYEDTLTPAMRVLLDDAAPRKDDANPVKRTLPQAPSHKTSSSNQS